MTKNDKDDSTGQLGKAPRQSVTFPPKTYEELERLAKEKKVSIAWVVREATERYIAEQHPLFDRKS